MPDRTRSSGFVVWLTGLSGAGKSTVADALLERFHQNGMSVELLDGDVVRTHLSKGLGFSKEDRDENVRRIGFVAGLLAKHGVGVVVAAISPYRAVREELKAQIPGFIEVYMQAPLEVLAERDVKGLYRRAMAGEIPNFTGVSDPYEPPEQPDVTVDSSREPVEAGVERIWHLLVQRGYLSAV